MDTPTIESVERALVAPETSFDEPPIESEQQPPQNAPDDHTPEGDQQPDADPQPGDGTGEPDQPTTDEPEEQAIGYDDLLPSRQAKTFPDEFLALAAQRWKVDKELLDDPTHGQNVRQLLTDKINSDIYIANQRREEAVREREKEATAADEKPPKEQEQQPEAPAQPQTWESIAQMAGQVAEGIVTDEGANHFGPRLYDALAGIATIRENEDADPKDVLKANRALTQVMSEFGVMLLAQTSPQIVNTILQDKGTQEKIFSPYIESVLERREGTVDQEAQVFDSARDLLAKEPGFADIAKISGEGGPLDQAAEAYFNETGKDIFDIQFVDPKTRQALPPVQNAMQQLRHAVTYMRGLNYQQPETRVREAMEKGATQERLRARRTELGTSLKPGKPTGRLDRQTTSAQEEMDDLIQASDRANPLSLEATSNRTR